MGVVKYLPLILIELLMKELSLLMDMLVIPFVVRAEQE
ncbi:UNVERIFIED_CONTAM: hypothetical protein GTU68_067227 [Idotea baltica]|nr:hypothetical protein [Idotea baltica]